MWRLRRRLYGKSLVGEALGVFGRPESDTFTSGFRIFLCASRATWSKTPNEITFAEAGQSVKGHGAGVPMAVFSSGPTDLDQLVIIVVDASKSFSTPAKLE